MRRLSYACLLAVFISMPAHAQQDNTCNALGPVCDRAIERAQDDQARSRLLFQRGYLKVEANRTLEAMADLDLAVRFDPGNASALRERAYIANELGDYELAERDLEDWAQLQPANVEFYRERAYARFFLGKLDGALADRVKVVELLPDDAPALSARGDDLMWAGKFEEAARDFTRERELAEKAGDANRVRLAHEQLSDLALWSANSGANAAANCKAATKAGAFNGGKLIGDCTVAFLSSKTGADKAEALTTRSTAWLIGQQNEANSTRDKQIAAALDPQDPKWHSNLGYAYVQARHSWAGEREFDKAIALERSWYALAGRAAARLNLQKVGAAKEDALASLAIQPNELAHVVLGDIAMLDPADRTQAKTHWMTAYKLGNRGDGLMARLESVGVGDPAREP